MDSSPTNYNANKHAIKYRGFTISGLLTRSGHLYSTIPKLAVVFVKQLDQRSFDLTQWALHFPCWFLPTSIDGVILSNSNQVYLPSPMERIDHLSGVQSRSPETAKLCNY